MVSQQKQDSKLATKHNCYESLAVVDALVLCCGFAFGISGKTTAVSASCVRLESTSSVLCA